MGQKAIIRF